MFLELSIVLRLNILEKVTGLDLFGIVPIAESYGIYIQIWV